MLNSCPARQGKMPKTNCRPAPSISFSPGLSHDTWSSWRASNPSLYLCPANVAMLPLHQNTCLWDMSLKHWNRDQKILDLFIQQNPKFIVDDQGRLWTFWVHHCVCRVTGDEPESWRYLLGSMLVKWVAEEQIANFPIDLIAKPRSAVLHWSSARDISLSLFDCTVVSFSFLFRLGSPYLPWLQHISIWTGMELFGSDEFVRFQNDR